MKERLRDLFQQLMEELKNKKTQKVMIWSLIAAVGFLVIVGIFSGMSSCSSKDDTSETKETESDVSQEEENDKTLDKTFYLDFSNEMETIYVATVSGILEEEDFYVLIMYDKVNKVLNMTYNQHNFSYSIPFEEGIAYVISLQEKNGVISIKQDDVTLCLAALMPKEECKWTAIDIVSSENGNDEPSKSEDERESSSAEVEQNSSNSSNESSSQPVSADNGKINYLALLRDIVISALIAVLLTLVVLVGMIGASRKANPIEIMIATFKDTYSNKNQNQYRTQRYERTERKKYEEHNNRDDDTEDDSEDDESDEEDNE